MGALRGGGLGVRDVDDSEPLGLADAEVDLRPFSTLGASPSGLGLGEWLVPSESDPLLETLYSGRLWGGVRGRSRRRVSSRGRTFGGGCPCERLRSGGGDSLMGLRIGLGEALRLLWGSRYRCSSM